ncbi:hypothetical protein SMICM17S_02979 [Streptomyces microflavus]
MAGRRCRLNALTPRRDSEVLELIALRAVERRRSRQRLVLAEQTVETHIGRVLAKLDLAGPGAGGDLRVRVGAGDAGGRGRPDPSPTPYLQ